jgi:hypothetical protein
VVEAGSLRQRGDGGLRVPVGGPSLTSVPHHRVAVGHVVRLWTYIFIQ